MMQKILAATLFVGAAAIVSSNFVLADDKEKVVKPDSVTVAAGDSPSLKFDAKGHLHVAFGRAGKDASGNQSSDVFITESEDGGKTWSAPVQISEALGRSSHPSLFVEKSGALDVAWSSGDGDPDVYFSRSTDGGKTWAKPVDVSNTPGSSTEPALAASSDGTLHMVWCDTSKGARNKDVYYSYSKDLGKTWGKDPLQPAEDISNTPGVSSEPQVVVDDEDSVHVAWTDSTPGQTRPDIFYSSLSAGSNSSGNGKWTKPVDLSDNTRISSHPGIATGPNGKVYLVWSDSSKELHLADVWCMVGDHGKFGKQQNVSNTAGVSTQPCISGDDTGRVVISWSDTSIEYNRPEVYIRTSRDKCANLSHITDMSNTQGSSKNAHVVINKDRLYVIWEEDDERSGTHLMLSSTEF
ncbi:MAG TPA: sialidase family protein [Oculatellaceae cyanobacterium]